MRRHLFSLGIFAVSIQRQDVIICNDNTLQYVLLDKEDVDRRPQAAVNTSSRRKRGMLRKSDTAVLIQVYESSKEKNLE